MPVAPGRLAHLADMIDGDHEDMPWARIERVVVTVRVLVIVSIVVLLWVGPPVVRHHLPLAIPVLAMAGLYTFIVLLNPTWELRGSQPAQLITAVDGAFTMLIVATTGAAESPGVSVLFLVVAGAAIRLHLRWTLGVTFLLCIIYIGISILVDSRLASVDVRIQHSMWWSLYLLLAAALGGSLALFAEQEHEAGIAARVEAIAEHKAAEEERDLRGRLLESYEAQREGLQVILHEFRTPVASLSALTRGLDDAANPMNDTDRALSTHLVAQHVEHLAEMLSALGDVAASWNPTFSAGRIRDVDVWELVTVAGYAAGLTPPNLQVFVHDDTPKSIRVDYQRLRRVLTNLIENAARHGEGHPVEVHVQASGGLLRVQVLDRGPGVAPELLKEITAKRATAGNRPDNSGLGLWIVDQILQATGGALELAVRNGGGLAARFDFPLQ